MTTPYTKTEKRLRLAGSFIGLGLLVELISLFWEHPTAFLFFVIIGGVFLLVGLLLYLLSIVTRAEAGIIE